jgi:[acyl-carrier-protein] S-malonyltransferase
MQFGSIAMTRESTTSSNAPAPAGANVLLCPGQGAQAVGMGRKWHERSAASRTIFEQADRALGTSLGAPLSEICFHGPAERLNQTDVSQPAIYVCSIASYHGLVEIAGPMTIVAAAGLSLGEYTALHLAGVFDFVTGLKLVALRGRLMQQAAVASKGGMVALIGADDAQAQAVCDAAAQGEVLVCANFNAPGQIVLSGHAQACERAVQVASDKGLKATPLTVAGAFHSALMQPAADEMAVALRSVGFSQPGVPVWSNVTAQPHETGDSELLKQRLVQQIVSPVRWSQSCAAMAASERMSSDTLWQELAPGSVLRGLMRRIDRNIKVVSHDEP